MEFINIGNKIFLSRVDGNIKIAAIRDDGTFYVCWLSGEQVAKDETYVLLQNLKISIEALIDASRRD